MQKVISIGKQNFVSLRENDCFYIDKTDLICKWWESKDEITLITRPRRFGKTLNMSMLNCFFSNQFTGREDLFKGLVVWKKEKYRKMQGTYPVIFLNFSAIKGSNYEDARDGIIMAINEAYSEHRYLLESNELTDGERKCFEELDYYAKNPGIKKQVANDTICNAVKNLANCLSRYYKKKVIILLDEYDTPMQEAYLYGYWKEFTAFIRSLFNATFKTNPYLERAMMTGITRVSKESVFSDLNNLNVVTTTSTEYETCFGFSEEEVFQALEERGMNNQKKLVKSWYDGFVFGNTHDIYNPWSITNFLDKKQVRPYWADTSSNSMIDELIRKASTDIKEKMEELLQGKEIVVNFDEQIVFEQLDNYNQFMKALLSDDIDAMNYYMNQIIMTTFSYFDVGQNEPERFYHGFVLGLIADQTDIYEIRSNRESGFGRYDVMMIPKIKETKKYPAIIMEFKVRNIKREESLEDTVQTALTQIKEKCYDAELYDRGLKKEEIHHYGFAFEGKKVLIG
ncbi:MULTISPECIES: AAA family ATPase [unclassified Coprococcus]|uniref:AAA family ATPase n=1 Tax=unclassified Coprococcus TaxID=2684943 RepID=UPI0022DF30AF|nr:MULTISPECIES: AAA family ATPase [unclassified Coprococcus]